MCCCCGWVFSMFLSIFLFFGFFCFHSAYNKAVAEGVISVKASTPMFIFLVVTVLQFFGGFLGIIGIVITIFGAIINTIVLWKLRGELLRSKEQTVNVQKCLKWCNIFLVVSIINALQTVCNFGIVAAGISFKK